MHPRVAALGLGATAGGQWDITVHSKGCAVTFGCGSSPAPPESGTCSTGTVGGGGGKERTGEYEPAGGEHSLGEERKLVQLVLAQGK